MIIFPDRTVMAQKLFCEKIGIEVGVFEGDYSKILLSCNPKKLFLLDCWEKYSNNIDPDTLFDFNPDTLFDFNNCYEKVKNELGNISNVEIVKKYSQDFVKEIPDEYFDFIYLDANHSYNAVLQDLKAWYPKVKKGGIFAGHDYIDENLEIFRKLGYSWIEVRQALQTFLNGKELDYLTSEELICVNENGYYSTSLTKSWGIIKP